MHVLHVGTVSNPDLIAVRLVQRAAREGDVYKVSNYDMEKELKKAALYQLHNDCILSR